MCCSVVTVQPRSRNALGCLNDVCSVAHKLFVVLPRWDLTFFLRGRWDLTMHTWTLTEDEQKWHVATEPKLQTDVNEVYVRLSIQRQWRNFLKRFYPCVLCENKYLMTIINLIFYTLLNQGSWESIEDNVGRSKIMILYVFYS